MTYKQEVLLGVVCVSFGHVFSLLWQIPPHFKIPKGEIKGMNECLRHGVPSRGVVTLHSSFDTFHFTTLDRG